MGYAVKGKTLHTYEPSRSIVGKGAKAANAWAWELCKAGRLESWSYLKGEGFRVAETVAEHRALFGRDEWATLPVMDVDRMLGYLADLDPAGDHVPTVWADTCRKVLPAPLAPVSPIGAKTRGSVVKVRRLLAELAEQELSEDARALLDLVAEVAA